MTHDLEPEGRDLSWQKVRGKRVERVGAVREGLPEEGTLEPGLDRRGSIVRGRVEGLLNGGAE